uniref:Uncharacterized protein n=1 Tax=Glossina brevipalpis TaxID=37001 RepID=A0A1A9WW25_9MUSC
MLIIRSRFLSNHKCIKLSKRYISDEFRKVFHKSLDNSEALNQTQLQLTYLKKNVNEYNLDLFLNNLSHHDDRRSVILDLMAHLRASKLANKTLESTHFAAVRYLLENCNLHELIPILTDRLQYGIFLNNFTSFAVLESVHKEKEYRLALPLVLKLILHDELDSSFVQAFCVKSCFEVLKHDTSDEVHEKIPEENSSSKEKKVRVKFLRNPLIVDKYAEMGKALLKINKESFPDPIKEHSYILGLLLSKRFTDLQKIMERKSNQLYEDVYVTCLEFLKKHDQEFYNEFNKHADQCNQKQQFIYDLDILLQGLIDKEEPLIIKRQEEVFPIWQEQRKIAKQSVEKESTEKERKMHVGKILNDISTKEELLWYFDREEDIELQIYNKRVFYPKRWFGKKKKPRSVDEHYVPPEIRKID